MSAKKRDTRYRGQIFNGNGQASAPNQRQEGRKKRNCSSSQIERGRGSLPRATNELLLKAEYTCVVVAVDFSTSFLPRGLSPRPRQTQHGIIPYNTMTTDKYEVHSKLAR